MYRFNGFFVVSLSVAVSMLIAANAPASEADLETFSPVFPNSLYFIFSSNSVASA